MNNIIGQLDHITILTNKLNESIEFYTNIFDLKIADWRPNFSFSGAWLSIQNNAIIHLVEVGELYRNTGNIDHVALQGKDLPALKEKLKSHKIKFLEKVTPDNMNCQIFITDPNTVKIELTYPKL